VLSTELVPPPPLEWMAAGNSCTSALCFRSRRLRSSPQHLRCTVSCNVAISTTETRDPELAKLVRLLVEGVAGPSRFLFTSRLDFSPVEAWRLPAEVGHLGLGEMGFREAVYLTETLPVLERLPVAVLEERWADAPAMPRALSKRDVYEKLGGHPYTLNLFAEQARRSSVEEVLAVGSPPRKHQP
jgi:hypothetical protein